MLLAATLLAGCAAAATPSADPSSPPVQEIHVTPRPSTPVDRTTGPVCGHVDEFDRLVIRRVDPYPGNHLHFSFPEVVTVSHADRVREVAHAVCTLPDMPDAPMSCRLDWAVVYQLGFDAAPVIQVGATGCQRVAGIDPIGWTALSPEFWDLLATVIDVPRAALSGQRFN